MNLAILILVFNLNLIQGLDVPDKLSCNRMICLQSCLNQMFIGLDTTVIPDRLVKVTSLHSHRYIASYIHRLAGDDDHICTYSVDSVDRDTYSVHPLDTLYYLPDKPEILSAFTANADSDQQEELIVLYGWYGDDINFRGYTYQVMIYDQLSASEGPYRLQQKSLTLFPRESEANRQGERLHAKYNTEAKIRKRLIQLGYK